MPTLNSASPAEQMLSKPLSTGFWLGAALARIDALIKDGRIVPGLGDFRPTQQAAGKMRLELKATEIDSLPSATIVPISGGGLMASWRSRTRCVEITVYHDGEVVRDAMDGGTTNETISELDTSLMLRWLSGQLVLVNAIS